MWPQLQIWIDLEAARRELSGLYRYWNVRADTVKEGYNAGRMKYTIPGIVTSPKAGVLNQIRAFIRARRTDLDYLPYRNANTEWTEKLAELVDRVIGNLNCHSVKMKPTGLTTFQVEGHRLNATPAWRRLAPGMIAGDIGPRLPLTVSHHETREPGIEIYRVKCLRKHGGRKWGAEFSTETGYIAASIDRLGNCRFASYTKTPNGAYNSCKRKLVEGCYAQYGREE